MSPNDDDFLFIPNPGFDHDPDYPYLVINVSGEPEAKFTNRYSAYLHVKVVLEKYGRVIDTRP